MKNTTKKYIGRKTNYFCAQAGVLFALFAMAHLEVSNSARLYQFVMTSNIILRRFLSHNVATSKKGKKEIGRHPDVTNDALAASYFLSLNMTAPGGCSSVIELDANDSENCNNSINFYFGGAV